VSGIRGRRLERRVKGQGFWDERIGCAIGYHEEMSLKYIPNGVEKSVAN